MNWVVSNGHYDSDLRVLNADAAWSENSGSSLFIPTTNECVTHYTTVSHLVAGRKTLQFKFNCLFVA